MGEFVTQVEGWTPVFDQVVAEVGLTTAAVYGIVWRYCQMADGVCRASQETLGARLGMRRETVLRHLRRLVRAGYLRNVAPTEGRAQTYALTGKAGLRGRVEAEVQAVQTPAPSPEPVTESHTMCADLSHPPVIESHTTCANLSQVPVIESHTKRLYERLSRRLPEETTEDTHGGGSPPRVRAGPSRSPDDDPAEIAAVLAARFARATGIDVPRPASEKQRRAADALWARPLAEMAQLAGCVEEAELLVDAAVERLREKGCIVKAPLSILATARALAGQGRARRDRFRRQAERYGDRVRT